MKKFLFVLASLFIFLNGFSQNQAELLKYVTAKTAIDSIGDALADIALQNPQLRSLEADAKSSGYTWQASKLNILNDLSVAGNVNEYSIKGNTGTNGNLLYPRYNLGIRVTLGELFTNGKISKANLYKHESDIEKLKLARQNIRMQVISTYQDYALTQKLLALQQDVLQDELVSFSQTEEKFKNGEATLDIYSRAGKAYNAEQVKQVTLTRDLKVTQAQLEALIGMPLSDAFNQIRATNPTR